MALAASKPSVPGNDRPVRADQDRVGEPELPDRRHDLFDLAFRVRAWIARAGNKGVDRPVGDGERAIGDSKVRLAHGCNLLAHIVNKKNI